jgi:galactan endo-beta-1,3-galactanase
VVGLNFCRFTAFVSGILAGFLTAGRPDVARATWETLVDGTSFNSVNAFTNQWKYNYPWGTDHNGSARMNATNVTVSGGVVTLTSSLTNTYEGTSSVSPHLAIRYNSGTFYLKQQITISAQYPVWDISGSFKVPTQTGTWPAFWMTGVNTWPPESDFMEFKGSSTCWQNTYDDTWQNAETSISSAGTAWHTYRMVAILEDSTNVDFHYYIDGNMVSEQTASTFVGSPCWLIVDYQMEGSSGSPGSGPTGTTYTYVTNIVVKYEDVSGVGSGPVANGAYKLLAQSTGDSLDVLNQYTTNNSMLGQWPYHAGLNEQWIATCLGNGTYSILGRQSGRALGILGASNSNGTQAIISDYGAGNDQQWTITAASGGYYELVNVNSGKTLEVANNSVAGSAPIDQWAAAGSSPPQFTGVWQSGTNLAMNSSAGVPGISYTMLTSSNLAAPLSNWTAINTNVIYDASGHLSFTNGIAPGIPRQFFQVHFPSANGASNQQWTFLPP